MPLTYLQLLEVIETLEAFLDRRRPSEEIREKVDLSYEIDNQSVIVFELRPAWNQPGGTVKLLIAKATYVMNKRSWKVFWQRADLKWHPYNPKPIVKNIREFVNLVEEDEYSCFWG